MMTAVLTSPVFTSRVGGLVIFFMGQTVAQALSDIGVGTVQVKNFYWAFIEAKEYPPLLESSQTF